MGKTCASQQHNQGKSLDKKVLWGKFRAGQSPRAAALAGGFLRTQSPACPPTYCPGLSTRPAGPPSARLRPRSPSSRCLTQALPWKWSVPVSAPLSYHSSSQHLLVCPLPRTWPPPKLELCLQVTPHPQTHARLAPGRHSHGYEPPPALQWAPLLIPGQLQLGAYWAAGWPWAPFCLFFRL